MNGSALYADENLMVSPAKLPVLGVHLRRSCPFWLTFGKANRRLCLAFLALAVAAIAKAQPQIRIGDFDPPALDGLYGEIGCVAYHLDSVCDYVLGYVVNGPETVVVLEEFQRRLESGKAQYLILDLVNVPEEFVGTLKVVGCRYNGNEMQPIVTAISESGDPGDCVGPADWVIVVDFAEKKLVTGDPQAVECWIGP